MYYSEAAALKKEPLFCYSYYSVLDISLETI